MKYILTVACHSPVVIDLNIPLWKHLVTNYNKFSVPTYMLKRSGSDSMLCEGALSH